MTVRPAAPGQAPNARPVLTDGRRGDERASARSAGGKRSAGRSFAGTSTSWPQLRVTATPTPATWPGCLCMCSSSCTPGAGRRPSSRLHLRVSGCPTPATRFAFVVAAGPPANARVEGRVALADGLQVEHGPRTDGSGQKGGAGQADLLHVDHKRGDVRATRWLTTGQWVTLDGTAGMIHPSTQPESGRPHHRTPTLSVGRPCGAPRPPSLVEWQTENGYAPRARASEKDGLT